jgi:sugar phosphate isomerase/epimerase
MSITRRDFMKISAVGAAVLATSQLSEIAEGHCGSCGKHKVRLGGPEFAEWESPEGWVKAVKAKGYSAAYCPIDPDAADDVIKAYEKAAKEADIIIAEVGAWNNPLNPDDDERKEAIEYCKACLELADKIGAKCCVNVCGSRGDDGINLTEETFDMIVEVVREIVDDVKPTRSFYALETLPKRYPDSVDSYVRIVKAINRKGCAAHMDPVNLINCPERYYNNGKLIKEAFDKLGPYIKSCHGKDIQMREGFPVNLQECQPGLGKLDYTVYLTEVSKLKDVPIMLEHLEREEEYDAAAKYIRGVGKETGIVFA